LEQVDCLKMRVIAAILGETIASHAKFVEQ
jgi:hypothetical protein